MFFRGLLVSMLAGSGFIWAGCTQEQQAEMDGADFLARGQATYEDHCGSCHGADGEGDGPVADLLTVPPADLTQLTSAYGGRFPTEEVYRMIDGRTEVQAHGTREMPIWGNIWREQAGVPVPEDVVEQRINELVEYLRSIQDAPAQEESVQEDTTDA